MARRLAVSDEYDVLILDMREVAFLDSSASLALEDAIKQAQGHDKQVFLVGVRSDVEKPLRRLGVLKLLPADHHHVARLDALRQAAAEVRARQSGESIQLEKSAGS
jgi:SulP family sulfate permease